MRRIRLYSGLVLFAFLATHLVSHALGLISLDAAEAGMRLAVAVWHSRIGTALLYGAALVHVALALRTLFTRAHWALPPIEIIRLAAGFSLPWLLIGHAVSARLATEFYGAAASYTRIVSDLVASGNAGWQFALLAPGWVHGCLGLWIYLRRKALAVRHRALIAAIALAIPALSAAGFWTMAQTLSKQPATYIPPLPPTARLELLVWRNAMTRNYLILIGVTFLAGLVWRGWQRNRAPIIPPPS